MPGTLIIEAFLSVTAEETIKEAVAGSLAIVKLDATSRAIRATESSHGSAVSYALRAWLSGSEFQQLLTSAVGSVTEDDLVQPFLTVLRLTGAPADEVVAAEILTRFFAEWRRFVLSGAEATRGHDELEQARYEQTIKRIDISDRTQNAKLDAILAAVESNKTVDKAIDEELALASSWIDAGNLVAARDLLRKREQSVPANDTDTRKKILERLGVAELKLRNPQDARRYLSQALEIAPLDAINLSRLALVQLELGEDAEGVRLAKHAFDIDPNAAGTRINLAVALVRTGDEKAANELLQAVDDDAFDDAAAPAAAEILAAIGERDRAERICRRVLAQTPMSNRAALALAATLFSREEDPFSIPDAQRLNEATALLNRVIESASHSGDRLTTARALSIRAAIRGLLREVPAGIADCVRTLELDPTQTDVRRNKALFHLELGQKAQAIDELKQLIGTDHDASARILLAKTQIDCDDYDGAVSTLSPLVEGADDDERYFLALDLTLDAHWKSGEQRQRATIIETLRAGTPSAGRLTVLALDHFRRGEVKEAVTAMSRATALASASDRKRLTIQLAELYARDRRWAEAALAYQTVVSEDSDPDIGARFVVAAYNGGEWRAALAFARRYVAKHGFNEVIVDLQARIEETVGNLDAARALYEQLVIHSPEKPEYRLRHAEVQVRLQRPDLAREIVKAIPPEALRADASTAVRAARLMQHLNLAGSLELAYAALRRSFNDPEVQAAYLSIYLGDEKECEVVEPDTIVDVRFGDSTSTYSLTSDDEEATLPGVYPMASSVAKELLGKKVDEQVAIGPRTGTVISIKSKYGVMWGRVLSEFNERFRDSRLVRSGDTPEEFLHLIEEQGRRKFRFLRLYAAGEIPLGSLSHLTGQSPIHTWGWLLFGADTRFYAAEGAASTYQSEERTLSEASTLVLDLTSLATLVWTGAHELIFEAFRYVIIPQRVLDEVSHELSVISDTNREGLALSYEHGTLTAAPLEDVRTGQHTFLEKLHAAAMRCKRVGVEAFLDIKPMERESLSRLLGEPTLASALLAASDSGNAILIVDDLVSARVITSRWSVRTASSLSLLYALRGKGLLESSRFREIIRSLSQTNYSFLRTNVDDICDALLEDHYFPTASVMQHLAPLSGPDCDVDAAGRTLSAVLKKAWLQCMVPLQKSLLVDVVADAMCSGRDPQAALRVLSRHIGSEFMLLPLAQYEVMQSLRQWRQLRFGA